MKRLFFVILGTLFAPFLSAEWPGYTQILTADFASEEDAAKAKLSFLPLPEGKKVAFTCRWDDTNPKDLKMSNLLYRHGFRATFFLNASGADFDRDVTQQLLRHGSSIGNHTLNHSALPRCAPNEMFRQVMALRIQQECKTQTPVIAFVLPYWSMVTGVEANTPRIIGDILKRSGHFGSCEFLPGIHDAYGLKHGDWFNPHVFDVGDVHPSAEQFHRKVGELLNEISKNPEYPAMALGVHCYQTPEGMKILDRCFARYANRPDWWYCNMNEYIAYRFQFHNTRTAGKSEGKRRIWTIFRPAPFEYGAVLPLACRITPSPLYLHLDGVPVKGSLPHASDERLPTIIGELQNGTSPRNPGLQFNRRISLKENRLHVLLRNNAKEPMTALLLRFRLPPLWETGVLSRSCTELASGKEIRFTVDLGTLRREREFRYGPLFFAVQLDFCQQGGRQRFYAAETQHVPVSVRCSPAECALFRTIPAVEVSMEKAKIFSRPETPLGKEWKSCDYQEGQRPFLIRNGGKDSSVGERFYYTVLELDARRSMRRKLHVSESVRTVFLNGRECSREEFRRMLLNKGRNRILFVTKGKSPTSFFAAFGKRSPSDFMKMSMITNRKEQK